MTEPSISYRLAKELGKKTGQEIRVTVPGISNAAEARVLMTVLFLHVLVRRQPN